MSSGLIDELSGGGFRTERLAVRRVREGDWRNIQSIWLDFDTSEYRYYDMPRETSDDAVMHRIVYWASLSDSFEHMFFSVCLQERVIGYFSFNIGEDCYETGYCFHRYYSGKGYASESFRALTERLGAAGMSRIIAGTALRNLPSVRFLEKNGFALYDTQRLAFHTDENNEPVFFEGGWFEKYL